jgi:hypothetical protein
MAVLRMRTILVRQSRGFQKEEIQTKLVSLKEWKSAPLSLLTTALVWT